MLKSASALSPALIRMLSGNVASFMRIVSRTGVRRYGSAFCHKSFGGYALDKMVFGMHAKSHGEIRWA
jgi:hypothetical protein